MAVKYIVMWRLKGETEAARRAGYANHPEHLRARQELGDTRTERYQVDYLVQ